MCQKKRGEKMKTKIQKIKDNERMMTMTKTNDVEEIIMEWIPEGHHVNKNAQKKAEEAMANMQWIAKTITNEGMEIFVTSPVNRLDKGIHINITASHIDIWTKEMNERFIKVLANASVYEIYSVRENSIRIDLSFNDIYLPNEDFVGTKEDEECAKAIFETIFKSE